MKLLSAPPFALTISDRYAQFEQRGTLNVLDLQDMDKLAIQIAEKLSVRLAGTEFVSIDADIPVGAVYQSKFGTVRITAQRIRRVSDWSIFFREVRRVPGGGNQTRPSRHCDRIRSSGHPTERGLTSDYISGGSRCRCAVGGAF